MIFFPLLSLWFLNRINLTNILRTLCRVEDMVWLVFGNFNEIINQNEKGGGRPLPEKQMKDFRDVLTDCDLRDLVKAPCILGVIKWEA